MSSSRDGGHDRELITVANRRGEAPAEPDVFVVEVKRHERIWLPGVVDETRGERREATGDVGDCFTDSGT